MNKNQISKICEAFDLGAALGGPTPVSGGLIYRMWRVNTKFEMPSLAELILLKAQHVPIAT